MNSSEQINEIAGALAKAQAQMGAAKKDSDNPFFKSKYADLASVVDAIRGPFAENNLSYVQLPIVSEGNRVMVETVLMHATGQWISSVVDVPVSKADAQGYGSAITYARRYGLQAIAGVAAEDDDGNAAAKAKPRPSEADMMPRAKAAAEQIAAGHERMEAYYAAAPEDPQAPSGAFGVTSDGEIRVGVGTAAAKGKVTFTYKNGSYSTQGMTKDQFVLSLDLAKKVAVKYKDPQKAHKLLVDEFGVSGRSDLTEETAERYCVRLRELVDSE